MLESWSEGMQIAMAARASIGEDRFVDVSQREQEADPIGVAEQIYNTLGWDLTNETRDAMQMWVTSNRKESRPTRDYSLEKCRLSAEAVISEFTDYLDAYGEYCR